MKRTNTNKKFWSYKHNIFFVPSIFGLFIFLFLYLLQPLGISEIEPNKILFTFSFGLITFLVLLLHDIFRRFIKKKEFSFNSSLLDKLKGFMITIPIAIFNWIDLKLWQVGQDFNFWIMLLVTIILGSIPYFYILLFVERKYYMENFYELRSVIEKNDKKTISHDKTIQIDTENKNEDFKFFPKDLIFIKAEGNYAQLNFWKDNKIEKKLVRISLSKILEQIKKQNSNEFVRNHKSYIVNLQNVDKVKGNSRNYRFHLKNTDITIPVSRNFSKDIIEQLPRTL